MEIGPPLNLASSLVDQALSLSPPGGGEAGAVGRVDALGGPLNTAVSTMLDSVASGIAKSGNEVAMEDLTFLDAGLEHLLGPAGGGAAGADRIGSLGQLEKPSEFMQAAAADNPELAETGEVGGQVAGADIDKLMAVLLTLGEKAQGTEDKLSNFKDLMTKVNQEIMAIKQKVFETFPKM